MWIYSYAFATGIDFRSATILIYLCGTPRNLLSRRIFVPSWPSVVTIGPFLFGKLNLLDL